LHGKCPLSRQRDDANETSIMCDRLQVAKENRTSLSTRKGHSDTY